MVKNLHANAGDRCVFNLWVRKIPWKRATHSSILAWRIPYTEEPGGLQSIGLQRVNHDWSDLACMHIDTLTAMSANHLLSLLRKKYTHTHTRAHTHKETRHTS